MSDPTQFYGSLLESSGQHSPLFKRMCDSLFSYVDQNCDVLGLKNTGFIEPTKYVWLRVQVGANPEDAVLVQEVLQSFYDFARVPYFLTADGDVQLAKIDILGCLHLHTCQALVDPDAAYEDWTRYLKTFALVDPDTSQPFPAPFPRTCLPASGIAVLKQGLDAFRRDAAAKIEHARTIAAVRKTMSNSAAAKDDTPTFVSKAPNGLLNEPAFFAPAGKSSVSGWGKPNSGAGQLFNPFMNLAVSPRAAVIDVTQVMSSGCRCFYHGDDTVSATADVKFLSDLRQRNPSVREVQGRLGWNEEQRWNVWRKRAWDTSTPLRPPRRAADIVSDVARSAGHRGAVELQGKYTGILPVLRSSLASVLCSTFEVKTLLKELNELMRTSYTLDQKPGLQHQLQKCIDSNYDFGTAYGRLRPYWYDDFEELDGRLKVAEAEDREMRDSALDETKSKVINAKVPPRRVWDLYSNRVLPWWIPGPWKELPWALSHSWVLNAERENVMTDINGKEWPVPLPNDTNLERVRIELLNYGAEYVWLDVLCLRQYHPTDAEREAIRKEEWKLDVPTIGNVYRDNEHIFIYFSGLGRPFRIDEVKGERSWLNRAWTLQEATRNAFVGGIQSAEASLGFNGWLQFDNALTKKFYVTLDTHSRHARREADDETIYPVLDCMRGRGATNERDKICGLAYLLRSKILPAYEPDDSVDPWDGLLQTITASYRGDLLFLYPEAGEGMTWRPSWNQIKEKPLPPVDKVKLYEEVSYNASTRTCSYVGYVLRNCNIQGLTGYRPFCPKGQVHVLQDGQQCTFAVTAHHQHLIPDGSYILVGNKGGPPGAKWDPSHKYWVVAQDASEGNLRKVSVLRVESDADRRKLQTLGIAKEQNVTFI